MDETGGYLNQEEFQAEAEELLESLGRDLEALEKDLADGRRSPGRINSIFRRVHSLKGIAGLLGKARVTELAHHLEDFLDRLRMGSLTVDKAALDRLFEAHEVLETTVRGGVVAGAVVEGVERRLRDTPDRGGQQAASPLADADESPEGQVLRSLTEYEEHRLRESIEQRRGIHLVRARLAFDTFDTELRALIDQLNEAGEVISTLPSYSGDDGPDTMSFNLLLATDDDLERLEKRLPVPVALQAFDSSRVRAQASSGDVPSGAEADGEGETGAVESRAAWPFAATANVRVDLERLDRIMNSVGELILSRRTILSVARQLMQRSDTEGLGRELSRSAQDLETRLSKLQRSVLGARMVPVGQIVGRLSRLVRKLARESGKEIELQARGAETELDKVMIDRLLSPLTHLIRNAVDHGLETPAARRAAGKPARAKLTLSAAQRGNAVVLSLADDGRGLQTTEIHQAALRNGLVMVGEKFGAQEAAEAIFAPGLTSATAVTEVSGRGVGLDVVRQQLLALSGSIRVHTSPGQGTTFAIELPITLAIIQAMVVRAGGSSFAVPIATIVETLRAQRDALASITREPVFRLRGETLPVVSLGSHFGLASDDDTPGYLVVIRSGSRKLALGVDALIGQQEIVVKPVGGHLENIPGIAGATELGGEEAAVVIDATTLMSEISRLSGAA